MPGSGNFVITPISPHNLNVRPVVISDKVELILDIESRSGKFLLSCDSKTTAVSSDIRLTVRKAHYQAKLIRLKNYRYFSTLRNRTEEHTSELQSLMLISYTVFCLKKTQI